MMLIPRRNYGLNLLNDFFNDPFFAGSSDKSDDVKKLPVMRTDIGRQRISMFLRLSCLDLRRRTSRRS